MSAFYDEAGKSWYIKCSYKDRQGSRKSVTKRGFPTRKAAEGWEQDLMDRMSGRADIPLRVFSEVYLEDLRQKLRPSTLYRKEAMLRRWILPYLGDAVLTELQPVEILRWQNELLGYRRPDSGAPLRDSYLLLVHKELTALMHHAEKFYGLKENPVAQVRKIGTFSRIETRFWTKEEYLRFAEAVRPDRLGYICFEMLYWCGIRKGELRALNPGDFDLDRNLVRIRKTMSYSGDKETIGPVKDAGSRRQVVMPEFLTAEVKAWIEEQGFGPGDLVFPVSREYLNEALRAGARKAGVPEIRVHDLRHSHVSLLIHMGYSAVAIGKRVGHKSADITYAYAHMFPTEQEQIAADLAKLEGGADCGCEEVPESA